MAVEYGKLLVLHDDWVYENILDRGAAASGTWGANYVYSPSGLQSDILVIARKFDASGTWIEKAQEPSGSWRDTSIIAGSVQLVYDDATRVDYDTTVDVGPYATGQEPIVVVSPSGEPSGYYVYTLAVDPSGFTAVMHGPSGMVDGAEASGLFDWHWMAKASR
jgi:hypothetical protein